MKNARLKIIFVLSLLLGLWWLLLFVNGTREQLTNYLWQAGLSLISILYAIFGLMTAGRWSWLKSGVGKAVFFIALGILFWGLGQAGWTYFTIAQPNIEVPHAPILDFLYFASIPAWTYGIVHLSKATGAKYGFKKLSGKIFAVTVFILFSVLSYYFLIVVARGGLKAYFDPARLEPGHLPIWWIAFTDLGYAFGDAINLVLAVTIFGLSWKYLGGRFKKPIFVILFAFLCLYLADFAFSYYDGLGKYYNGHWADLGYLLVISLFGVSLVLMDPTQDAFSVSLLIPSAIRRKKNPAAAIKPFVHEQQNQTTESVGQ